MLAIPIFLFHRVGPAGNCPLTISIDVFEAYLRILITEGYGTLTCSELEGLVESGTSEKRRLCMLTFDDGYLDFWTYAAPLLHKYNCKATIFIIPARTSSSYSGPRPNLQDVWAGEKHNDDLYQLPDFHTANLRVLQPNYNTSRDYLSWEELEVLAEDGLIDIQCHGIDHLTEFISPRAIGFLRPGSHWTVQAATRHDLRLGVPIYELNSALIGPRYVDPAETRQEMVSYVNDCGGTGFFDKPGWRHLLEAEYARAARNAKEGFYEDEGVWSSRIKKSLAEFRHEIAARLRINVQSIAWPFGRCSGESARLARIAGYRLGFTAKCGGYISTMDPMFIGRLNFKANDAELFRQTLRRYTQADVIEEEYKLAVYEKPLGFPREGFSL